MQSKYKVVMLPTDEATNITKSSKTDKLYYTSDVTYAQDLANDHLANSRWINQHLYIVDTESTIEVGDWHIDLPERKLIKSKFGKHHTQVEGYHLKVIASTDTSLGLPLCNDEYFLQAICSYGIDGIEITKVEVNPHFTCSVSWRMKEKSKISPETYTRGEVIEHNLRIPSYENNLEKEFPQLKKAIEWWNNLSTMEQRRFTVNKTGNGFENLSTTEIEEIYNEVAVKHALEKLFNTVQNIRDGKISIVREDKPKDKPQVDFELLKHTLSQIKQGCDISSCYDERENLQDFFHWLGKDYDFAIKAHYALMTSDAK